jgi:hypothetical protein
MSASNYSSTIQQRLDAGRIPGPNGCLVWIKARSPFGYGRIGRGARGTGYEVTHRVAWELEHGPIPEGMFVLHHCDSPPCSNVDHLFLGTLSDNTQDMLAKGRHVVPRGERHGNARLTDEQVAELRRMAPSIGNYAELGRMYGITKQHTRALCLGMKR